MMRRGFGLIWFERRSAAEKNKKKLLVLRVRNLFKAFSLREPAHKALPARGKLRTVQRDPASCIL